MRRVLSYDPDKISQKTNENHAMDEFHKKHFPFDPEPTCCFYRSYLTNAFQKSLSSSTLIATSSVMKKMETAGAKKDFHEVLRHPQNAVHEGRAMMRIVSAKCSITILHIDSFLYCKMIYALIEYDHR